MSRWQSLHNSIFSANFILYCIVNQVYYTSSPWFMTIHSWLFQVMVLNEGTYDRLLTLWPLQHSKGHMVKIHMLGSLLAFTTTGALQLSLSPISTHLCSFGPPYSTAAVTLAGRHISLFLLLTKHIQPCPCEAAAGHMRLSSQGHAWWFPHLGKMASHG